MSAVCRVHDVAELESELLSPWRSNKRRSDTRAAGSNDGQSHRGLADRPAGQDRTGEGGREKGDSSTRGTDQAASSHKR